MRARVTSLLSIFALAATVFVGCGDDNPSNNGGTNNGGTNNGGTNNGGTNNGGTNNGGTNNGGTNNGGTNNGGTNNGGTNNGGAGPTGNLLVANIAADFSSSSYGFVDFDPQATLESSVTFGSGDVAVSVQPQYAYVLDRASGSAKVLSTSDLTEVGTPAFQMTDDLYGSNPQDVVEASAKIYASLHATGEVVVLSESNGTFSIDSRIDLSAYDPDGNPQAADMMVGPDGEHILVALLRLDDDDMFLAPREASAIAVIDSTSDTVVDLDDSTTEIDVLDLSTGNPAAGLADIPGGGWAVGLTGTFGEMDGNITLVETSTDGYVVGDELVSETDLGGDVSNLVMVDSTSGFALVGATDFSGTSLVHFAVDAGNATVTDVGAFEMASGLAITEDRGFVYVGERGADAGVYAIDVSNQAVVAGPLGFDLPPADLALLP